MNDHDLEHREPLWKHLIFPIALCAVAVAATSAFFLLSSREPADTRQPEPISRSRMAAAPKLGIRLYFASNDGLSLVEELRETEGEERLLDQMAHTLRELATGPKTNASPVIPEGTTVNAVYLDEGGVAYVDFSPELVSNHPGGICAEELTAHAIANSLAANYPRVTAVQLLVEGAEIETLAGHLDTRTPILPDFSLVKAE